MGEKRQQAPGKGARRGVGIRRALGSALLWGAALWGVASGGVSCRSLGPPLLCGQIPDGGCPIGRGGTCEDQACAALYDCVEGDWTLVTECAQGVGGGGGGAGDGGGGGGGCAPIEIDRSGETTGCMPDLQEPDCPASAAETCAASVCLTGCVDFFLCTAEGWSEVAYCTEDGQIVLLP